MGQLEGYNTIGADSNPGRVLFTVMSLYNINIRHDVVQNLARAVSSATFNVADAIKECVLQNIRHIHALRFIPYLETPFVLTGSPTVQGSMLNIDVNNVYRVVDVLAGSGASVSVYVGIEIEDELLFHLQQDGPKWDLAELLESIVAAVQFNSLDNVAGIPILSVRRNTAGEVESFIISKTRNRLQYR